MPDFTYLGQTYTANPDGTIVRLTPSGPVTLSKPSDIGLLSAAQNALAGTAAQGGAPPPAAPTSTPPAAPGGLPAVPPRTVITRAPDLMDPATDIPPTGDGTPPPVKPVPPVVPPKPPRAGVGSAVELRAQRDAIQKQIDDITNNPQGDGGPSNAQLTALGGLNTRMTGLTSDISKAETITAPTPVSGTATPDQEWIVTPDPDHPGQFLKSKNPAADPDLVAAAKAGRKAETHVVGNNIVTIGVDGSMTSTQVNAQAQANDDLVARAQSTSAAASALNAQVNKLAAESKATIDAMVARGEDAASVRAATQQEYDHLHQQWVEADGEAKRVQAALDASNAEKHASALDARGDATLAQTAATEAQRSKDTRYGLDKVAESSKYTADTGAKSEGFKAKLAAATNLYQNSLSALAEINKALPPGSDLAGKALEGMLAYGTKFLNGFAGGGGADPAAVTGVDPKAPLPPPPALDTGDGIKSAAVPTVATFTPAPGETSDASALRNGSPSGSDVETYADQNQMTWDDSRTALQAPAPAQVASNDALTQQLISANAAAHQANVADPAAAPTVGMHPDGTPIATADDVARVWGRQATITPVAQGGTGHVGAPR